MAKKRFKAEQIVVMLREAEVQMAKGQNLEQYAGIWGSWNRLITDGVKNTAA